MASKSLRERVQKCDKGRWRMKLDLSKVSGEEFVVFHVTHDRGSLCKEVRAGFTGPINYISIGPRENHYELGFHVMKYEAKVKDAGSLNAVAVSEPEGKTLFKNFL